MERKGILIKRKAEPVEPGQIGSKPKHNGWRKLVWFFLNPHLLLCVGIAWFLTNGWCYLFIFLSGWLHIPWMAAVGGAWATLVWLPFTPEKVLTLAITMFLLRLLFPNDRKTLHVLRQEEDALRRRLHGWQAKRRREKQAKRLQKALALRRGTDRPLAPPRENAKSPAPSLQDEKAKK